MSSEYFQSEAYLRGRFQAAGRQLGFRATTVEEWRAWHGELQGTLRRLLGVDRMIRTDPNARITETVQLDGYRRERVLIDTEPGVTMPFYVLIPDNLKGTAPAVIAAHGHDSGGKYAPAGRRDIPAMVETIEGHNYDYGVQAVRRGYVVFCPDARGFGERRESFSEGDAFVRNGSCRQLAHMGLPLGLTVAGMWSWDLSRLLDYVQTRPEVRGRKVASIGLSGGGLQTLYFAATDERVDVAVSSGYFYGVADSLLHLSDNCDCNYVPHLWEYADMGDLAALIAPRPFFAEAALQDGLNGPRGIDNVLEQLAITRRAYALVDALDHIGLDTFPGGHVWHGTVVWDWLDKWLCD
jgi:dienelactone hydrolase